ncbi:MAG: glycosyltransferase family 9 protein [Verrucomicrobiaceae bacterium]
MPLAGDTIIASPDSFEEACFSVPAVRALHHANPGIPITVTALEEIAPLWLRVPEVSQVIPHTGSARKLAKDASRFAHSIAWEPGPAAIAFAKADIAKRNGPPADKLAKLLTHSIKVEIPIGPIEHRVKFYLFFVEKMGAQAFDAINFQTPTRPPLPHNLRIAIAPGSDFGPAAEWPLDRFTSLAQRLQDCELLILPSPGKPGPAKQLAKSLGRNATLTGDDTETLLDTLASCHLLIGNDGALPHLAAHVGTTALVLFGPNEPDWKRPLGKAHGLIRHHVACSGCLLDKCPLDHRCMQNISVDEVLTQARSLLSSSPHIQP